MEGSGSTLFMFLFLSISDFVAVCVQEERSHVIRCLLANAKLQKYIDSVCCGQRWIAHVNEVFVYR